MSLPGSAFSPSPRKSSGYGAVDTREPPRVPPLSLFPPSPATAPPLSTPLPSSRSPTLSLQRVAGTTGLVCEVSAEWTLDVQEAALKKRLLVPPLRQVLATAWYEAKHVSNQHFLCVGFVGLGALLSFFGIVAALVILDSGSTCGVLANPSAPSVVYSISFPVATGAAGTVVTIDNTWPFGGVEVVAPHYTSGDNNFTVEVTSWAATAGALYDPSLINGSLVRLSNYNDSAGGWGNVSVGTPPPSTANANCQGLRLRVYSSAALAYTITAGSVPVNISGNLGDFMPGGPYEVTFTVLAVTTSTGPVLLNEVHAENPANAPLSPPTVPSTLSVVSGSGDVSLFSVLAASPTVTTGGTIRVSELLSSSPLLGCVVGGVPVVCGGVALTVTGSGRISVSQSFGAYTAALSTLTGDIVVANVVATVGLGWSLTSQSGSVLMSNVLQNGGNDTVASTGTGSIVLSSVTAHRLFASVGSGTGTVSADDLVLGLDNPGNATLPPPPSYAPPYLGCTTDRGSISALSVGASTTNSAFANQLSARLVSYQGAVKVEIAGGGYLGPYTARSRTGTTRVELDGVVAPSTGWIGAVGNATNSFLVASEGGDVQLSTLASPV